MERFFEAFLRRLVDALDGLAGLRDRIEQILALGGEERVAGFELVELPDRHHVHRAEALDLAAQVRDDHVGSNLDGFRGLRGFGRLQALLILLARFRRRRRGEPLRGRAQFAGGFHAIHFDDHRVNRCVHRIEALLVQVLEIRRGLGLRHLAVHHVGAHGFERLTRAADIVLAAFKVGAQAGELLIELT